jgi:ferredoxin
VVTQADGGTIDINVCNQCGTCIDICPVTAITRTKSGAVVVNKSLCVGCYSCVEYCPTGSMRTHASRLAPFKCIACGACVEACPAGALELAEGEFEASYLECEQAGEPGATFSKSYF